MEADCTWGSSLVFSLSLCSSWWNGFPSSHLQACLYSPSKPFLCRASWRTMGSNGLKLSRVGGKSRLYVSRSFITDGNSYGSICPWEEAESFFIGYKWGNAKEEEEDSIKIRGGRNLMAWLGQEELSQSVLPFLISIGRRFGYMVFPVREVSAYCLPYSHVQGHLLY